MITGKMYDVLKFLAQVVLPAVGTLYFTLAGLWGLPEAEAVVGTIVAVDTFLGVLLHISSSNFTAQGTLNVVENPGGKVFNLELNGDPETELEGKDKVVFTVMRIKGTASPVPPPRAKRAKKKT